MKALKERPQIQLDIPASYSPEVDGSVLATAKLNEKLQALADKQAAAKKKGAPPEAARERALADPSQRFDLLLAQYQGSTSAPRPRRPPAAAAVLIDGIARRSSSPPRSPPRTKSWKPPSRANNRSPNATSKSSRQARARAIQDALLASGEIEPARVFLLGATAAAPTDGKVRVALAA